MAYVTARQHLDPQHHPRLAKAIDLVVDGHVAFDAETCEATVGSQTSDAIYIVSDRGKTCSCPDFANEKAPDGCCKHRLAVSLFRAARRLDGELVMKEAEAIANDAPPYQSGIDPRHILTIKGRQFVRYEGLLAMAHASGLTSLRAEFIHVSADMATAKATATFADGRVFSECGDATPENVSSHVAPHFGRMALTRAKARCLRDALNIGMCAVEELGDHRLGDHSESPRAPFVPPAYEAMINS